jgi:hypothetical protein
LPEAAALDRWDKFSVRDEACGKYFVAACAKVLTG